MNRSVDYGEYQATFRPRSRGVLLDAARSAYRFIRRRVVYDTLMYPAAAFLHHRLLQTSDRSQGHTYTGFHRTPAQLQAICGPVLDHVLGPRRDGGSLDVLVFAGSNGAEAYTLASVLRNCLPNTALRIVCSDLHEEMVARGRAGRYTRDEVLHHPHITEHFLQSTFDYDGDTFVVKPDIRSLVSFRTANLLDSALPSQFAPAELVLAQNVMFHLRPADAERAFTHVAALLKPRSALCINGMDLGLRTRLTQEAGLAPLAFNARSIHDESRSHISAAWWRYYYGLEPYWALQPDHRRRYATIFLKG